MRKCLIFLTIFLCLLTGCKDEPHTSPTVPSETTRAPKKTVILETNPYSAEDFVRENGRMVYKNGTARTGIDVSIHQGLIDWPAVAADGIDFAMIRVGYRGAEDGEISEDANARRNIEGALAAGLDVGVYFFSQAVTPAEARQEAEYTVAYIEQYPITMPVAFDWEHVENDAARTTGIFDRNLLTECGLAFQEVVEAAGYTPMIYFNSYQADELLDLWLLRHNQFWFALYDAPMTFPWEITMWQYTEQGKVAGIKEKVDINLYFP